MARLVGVDLPRNKRIEIALTYIYGIGLTTAKEIIAATGVDPDIRVKDLSEEDLAKLRDYIQANIKVEGRVAVIEGVPRLSGAPVEAADLRGGAALVVAGLASRGATEVSGVRYIDRGYENLERSFAQLGASIRREYE